MPSNSESILPFGVVVRLMNSSFFVSLSGIALTVAGMATSTPSLANTLPTQTDNLLANQFSVSQMAEDDIQLLPEAITNAIFKNVMQQGRMEASQMRVVEVERQTWSDGCLGLASAAQVCTQAMVPGWRVVVANGEQRWVYRTDESGSLVKLDEVATQTLSRSTTAQTTRREVTTRTTQTSRTVTGTTNAQRSSSQSTQAVGTSQTTGGVTTRTQQQVAATRSSTQVSFSDISQNFWARDFIAELARQDIITGFPDGQFRPNEPVTRAQFAAMIRKAFEKTKVRNAISFRDVSTSYWAYNAIQEAYEMGFLDMASGSEFNPNQSLTRLQVMVALTKGLNYSASSSTESVLRFYSDAASIPADVRTLVAAATERGIVVNYPNVKTFSANTVATRAEVAAFLYQAMVSTGQMVAISSPYVVTQEFSAPPQVTPVPAASPAPIPVPAASPSPIPVPAASPAPVTPAPATPATVTPAPASPAPAVEAGEGDRNKPQPQNCNQGIGNGTEGCDPGNSRPRGGSNDEGGRTPGNRP